MRTPLRRASLVTLAGALAAVALGTAGPASAAQYAYDGAYPVG